ncbi:MAG: hypothetical protein WDN06_21530 [Asticcacaulis sp.]
MRTLNQSRLVVTTALAASAILAASMLLGACGKLGSLEQAPPFYGDKAKADWSSSNPGGGSTATNSSSASKATERAGPDANGQNSMANPYTDNKKIENAPLEGFGNATQFNNNSPH